METKIQNSILEQVLEQPVGNKENTPLEPFFAETRATFFLERAVEIDMRFIPGRTRCGSDSNNHVTVRVRVASDVRDANGFVFDNSLLTQIKHALESAAISTSCEDLAIFVASTIHMKATVPLKWISVAVDSDFEGAIGFTWRENDCMPRARLFKLGTEAEAQRSYEIRRQLEADLHITSCGGHK